MTERLTYSGTKEAKPNVTIKDVTDKLAHYEDSEEQVSNLLEDKVSLDDIVRHLMKALKGEEDELEFTRVLTNAEAEKWDKWKSLDEQGRLIELPCAVGDTVWFYNESLEEVCKGQVIGFGLNFYTTPQLWIEVEYTSSLIGNQTYKSRVDLMIGKKVFLTPEEAEAALKGCNNK